MADHPLCEICGSSSAKVRRFCEICTRCQSHSTRTFQQYKCPRCFLRSCSLGCSKSHKESAQCSGQRSTTHFIPKEALGPNELTSDYGFLESLYRIADNASRDNSKTATPGTPSTQRTRKWSQKEALLLKHASERGIQLELMPKGLLRNSLNQSVFLYKSKSIAWTVELDFVAVGKVIQVHQTSADSIIKDVLDEFLAPSTGNVTIRHALKDYISPCKLFLYMKKARCPSNAPAYYAVDSEATLDETLRGKLILEFPTFTVLTHPMNADVAIIPFDRALFEIDSVPAFS